VREATTTGNTGGALLGLIAAATLLVVGGLGYGLGGAVTATKAFASDMRSAAMHVAVPREEIAPRAAPDPMPEGRLREFEEAFAKAWQAGQESPSEPETENERIRAAATAIATGDTRTAIASATSNADLPPTTTAGTASAIAPTTITTGAATADPPAATVAASANLPAAAPAATNAIATAGANGTPAPTASTATPPASATDPVVLAVTSTTPTIVGDAGPSDLHVIIYTASWCDVCKPAEAWMVRSHIPYEERDITASVEYAQELRWISPSVEVPTFDVDGNVLVGFNPRQILVMVKRAALKRAAGAGL
jgi:glutaredoxin